MLPTPSLRVPGFEDEDDDEDEYEYEAPHVAPERAGRYNQHAMAPYNPRSPLSGRVLCYTDPGLKPRL